MQLGNTRCNAGCCCAFASGRDVPVCKSKRCSVALQELVSLVEDADYRLEMFGARELDWSRIEAHFGGRRCGDAALHGGRCYVVER